MGTAAERDWIDHWIQFLSTNPYSKSNLIESVASSIPNLRFNPKYANKKESRLSL